MFGEDDNLSHVKGGLIVLLKKSFKWLLVLVMVFLFFYIRNVHGIKNVESAHLWLHEIDQKGHVVSFYLIVTIVAGVLCLPISWFKACGALYFGFAYGFLYGYAIALISAVISFGIGRFLGKDWVDAQYKKCFKAKLTPRQLEWLESKGQIGFLHIFILRNLYFVPFFATNYLMSVSKVSFRSYFFATALGMLPGTGVFTYFVAHALDFWTNPFAFIGPFILVSGYYVFLYQLVKRKRLAL